MSPSHHILTMRIWLRGAALRRRLAREPGLSAAALTELGREARELRQAAREALDAARRHRWCPECRGRGTRLPPTDVPVLAPGMLILSGHPCGFCRGTGARP